MSVICLKWYKCYFLGITCDIIYAKITLRSVRIKLPNPRKRGDAYRIAIIFNGKRISATRDTAKDYEKKNYVNILVSVEVLVSTEI